MTTPTKELTLKDVRGLSTAQYDACKEAAITRIKGRAGERPNRRQFARQLEPLWNVLDVFALIVGLAALLVSSAHILAHAGEQAAVSYNGIAIEEGFAGDMWSRLVYGQAHQYGLIALSESAMILFMVMHSARQVAPRRKDESAASFWARRSLSIPLALALLSAVFVLSANLSADVGLLEAVLPPAVTIGLGVYFETKIAEMMRRQRETTARYMAAMVKWELAQAANLEEHPDYLPYLRQELAQKLKTYQPLKGLDEPPQALIEAAVARELYRDEWAYKTTATAAADRPTQAAQAAPLPELQPVQTIHPPTAIPAPAGNGNGNGSHR